MEDHQAFPPRQVFDLQPRDPDVRVRGVLTYPLRAGIVGNLEAFVYGAEERLADRGLASRPREKRLLIKFQRVEKSMSPYGSAQSA